MNKYNAKEIAKTISNDDLKIMFTTAKNAIKDWTVRSILNKGLTKGVAWNILTCNFSVDEKYSELVKTNMIIEFGEYLPAKFNKIKTKTASPEPVHQEPDLNNL